MFKLGLDALFKFAAFVLIATKRPISRRRARLKSGLPTLRFSTFTLRPGFSPTVFPRFTF